MSTGATALQILLTGGVAAGASGFILQRFRTRDELRQWQRGEMLRAAVAYMNAGSAWAEPLRKMVASTKPGIIYIDHEALDALHATHYALVDADSTLKLLFGLRSQTVLAADDVEDAYEQLYVVCHDLLAHH